MLYGIGPLDPLSYAAMGGAMLAAAAVAMFLPSRRAARVDPARELREE
jgi:ABC-type antimicrobial peptide transport system permease subunit